MILSSMILSDESRVCPFSAFKAPNSHQMNNAKSSLRQARQRFFSSTRNPENPISNANWRHSNSKPTTTTQASSPPRRKFQPAHHYASLIPTRTGRASAPRRKRTKNNNLRLARAPRPKARQHAGTPALPIILPSMILSNESRDRCREPGTNLGGHRHAATMRAA